jgi:threonine/homoserine/homoserine lactone efflux protein
MLRAQGDGVDMIAFAMAGALGCVAGFLGALPPGPVGMALVQHAREGRASSAVRIALGAASVDTAVCTLLALGAGPILQRLTAHAAARMTLSAVCLVTGVMLMMTELRRRSVPRFDGSPIASYASGVLRALANPALAANWTLLMAALLAHGLLLPGRTFGLAFAVGAGVGVICWFGLLVRLVGGARGRAIEPWLRAGTAVGGATLVVSGLIGAVHALGRG